VPPKLDVVLRLVKYPLLLVILWLTWSTGTLIIRPYDPLAAYAHLSAGFEAARGKFAECISCMECVSARPTRKGTLVPTLGGRAIKLGLVLALGFGIYFGAAAVGAGVGALRFLPQSLSQSSAPGTRRFEDVKSSNTWEMVAESFGIELELLHRESGVDPKKVPPATMLKDTGRVGGIEGFREDTVRVAVAKILGLPYSGVDRGHLSSQEDLRPFSGFTRPRVTLSIRPPRSS